MKNWFKAGIIISLEDMGADVVKITDEKIYILIKKGTDLCDESARLRAQKMIKKTMNLKLMYKII